MSTLTALHGNPFALLLDPSAVLAACKTSKPLSALRNAVHKPLDKPRVFLDTSAAEFDAAIDAGLPISVALPAQAAPTLPVSAAALIAAAPASLVKKSPSTAAGPAKRRGVPAAGTAYEAEPADAGEFVLTGRSR